MKIEDYVIPKEVSTEVKEMLDNIRRLLNNGGYVPQVLSGIPAWSGNKGEFNLYFNGKEGRMYIYDSTAGWNYGLPFTTKYGWDYITMNNEASKTKALAFGYTFQAAPIVLTSFLGFKTGAAPTATSDFDTGLTKIVTSAYATLTDGCTLAVYTGDGSATAAENRHMGVSWLAIG